MGQVRHIISEVLICWVIKFDIMGRNKHSISGFAETETKKVHQHSANGVYYCPMHCEGDKVYDKPGDCPVCGMDLVKQPELVQKAQYTCPMHPEVISDTPGSCPKCGMDLIKEKAKPVKKIVPKKQ